VSRGEYAVGRATRSMLGPRGRGGPAVVGAQLQHVLELSQRYDGVSAAGTQALLNGLGAEGYVASTGTNRWEVALRDGATVRISWDPHASALQVSVTDKTYHPTPRGGVVSRRFEEILEAKVTPRLATHGAITVGNVVYHSVGNREDALRDLETGYASLQDEVMRAAGWRPDPYAPASGPIWAWWQAAGLPTVNAWQRFHADQTKSYATRFATDWSEYEGWLSKLRVLRDSARRMGVHLVSPEPAALPTTVFEKAAEVVERGAGAVASGVGDVWKFVKYGAWAVLGVGVVVALSSAAGSLRSGRDPAERYVGMIRGRQSRQLALPAETA